MKPLRTVLVAICLLSAASGAWAEAPPVKVPPAKAPPAKAMPKAEPILTHMPAGSAGFVIINNAKATAGKVDKFIDELGLSQMLGAVLLDPKAFDVNLLEVFGIAGPPPMRVNQPAPAEGDVPAKPKVPFVIFVPGAGVKEVFGAYPMEAAGKYTLVKLPVGPVYAGQLGGYVIISPIDKALDAVIGAKKRAAAEMPAEQVKVLVEADLGYYMNMKVAGPILADILTQAGAQATRDAGPMAPLLATYMGIYRDIIKQLDSVTVGARLVSTGLVVEEMASFKADSAYGKAMAAAKPSGKCALDRLPNLKYVLAVGAVGSTNPQEAKLNLDIINALLSNEFFQGLPEAEKARLKKIAEGLNEQITAMQMFGGGAPEGSGVFGVSFVIRCKNADKVKQLLAEKATFAEALIKHIGKDDEDVKKLTIRYVEGVETIGSVSADAITIEHPELTKMSDSDREDMRKVLGEDKIRLLVAAADKQTVVVTFGGSRAFLIEALKAASGKGTIGSEPDAAEALKHLPKNRSAVVLLNGGNLFELIVAGMAKVAPNEELPPFRITCKAPIALGAGTTGESAHVVLYVPTKLVKEVVGVVMMFAAPRREAPPPPVGPADL